MSPAGPLRQIRMCGGEGGRTMTKKENMLTDASDSVLSLKNKAALTRANVTHVVSVLRLQQLDDTLSSVQHHRIDVDDVEDENLLEHFPAAVKFIQSGLDSGGSVLVHWFVKPFSSKHVSSRRPI